MLSDHLTTPDGRTIVDLEGIVDTDPDDAKAKYKLRSAKAPWRRVDHVLRRHSHELNTLPKDEALAAVLGWLDETHPRANSEPWSPRLYCVDDTDTALIREEMWYRFDPTNIATGGTTNRNRTENQRWQRVVGTGANPNRGLIHEADALKDLSQVEAIRTVLEWYDVNFPRPDGRKWNPTSYASGATPATTEVDLLARWARQALWDHFKPKQRNRLTNNPDHRALLDELTAAGIPYSTYKARLAAHWPEETARTRPVGGN